MTPVGFTLQQLKHKLSLALSVSQLVLAASVFVVSVLLALDALEAQKAAMLLLSFSGLYLVFKVHELQKAFDQNADWCWHFMDGLFKKSDSMDLRLMGLEFSAYECARQMQGAIQHWDRERDAYYASRQCFQYCGRYARNFLQRTGQPVTSDQLSAMINYAIGTSGRNEQDLRFLRDQLIVHWSSELHGLPDLGYDQDMTVDALMAGCSAKPLTHHMQTEFYALSQSWGDQ